METPLLPRAQAGLIELADRPVGVFVVANVAFHLKLGLKIGDRRCLLTSSHQL